MRMLLIIVRKFFRQCTTLLLAPYYAILYRIFLQSPTKPNKTQQGPIQFIVSLTSHPARIDAAARVIFCLFRQSEPIDKIVLALSEEQFPDRKLPEVYDKFVQMGLEIMWGKRDLKPHKKYCYTMWKYPDSVVMTVDDDQYLSKHYVRKMRETHKRFPNLVVTGRVDLAKPPFSTIHNPQYNTELSAYEVSSCGAWGAIYPVGFSRLIFKTEDELFETVALNNEWYIMEDDAYLRLCEQRAGINIVVSKTGILASIPSTNKSALHRVSMGKRIEEAIRIRPHS